MNAYRNAVTTILKQMLLFYSATRTIEFLQGISRRSSLRPSIALFTYMYASIEMVDLVIPCERTWDFCGYILGKHQNTYCRDYPKPKVM
jgi:hypothetical protein